MHCNTAALQPGSDQPAQATAWLQMGWQWELLWQLAMKPWEQLLAWLWCFTRPLLHWVSLHSWWQQDGHEGRQPEP